MSEDITKRFLINNDDTGRFIVKSMKTGTATKRFETENYGQKYKGSIKPEESMITEENGFTNIHTIGVGVSPMDYINKIDNEYYEKIMSKTD